MSKRKLQVFISSTHDDLLEERQAAIKAILDSGHIPAGMEMFGSDNKNQMDVIHKWIDNCDICILILGGAYGSVPKTNNPDKKSYTHLEYDYACQCNKTPYVIIMDNNMIAQKIVDGIYSINKPECANKDYKKFKKEILGKENCSFFSSTDDLRTKIMNILNKFDDKYFDLHPVGWIKYDQIMKDVSLAKNILESSSASLDPYYNPYFETKYRKAANYIREFYCKNECRLHDVIDNSVFLNNYNRKIFIKSSDDLGMVEISTMVNVKYYTVTPDSFYTFGSRFNRKDEIESLVHQNFRLKIANEKWINLTDKLKSSIFDRGEGERWRYQAKLSIPTKDYIQTDTEIEMIHEYSFKCRIENIFQMNQLRFPCKNYSVSIVISEKDENYFPVVASCSSYNVYSLKSYESEQFKGEIYYTIKLPEWVLPGSGYFLTFQKRD